MLCVHSLRTCTLRPDLLVNLRGRCCVYACVCVCTVYTWWRCVLCASSSADRQRLCVVAVVYACAACLRLELNHAFLRCAASASLARSCRSRLLASLLLTLTTTKRRYEQSTRGASNAKLAAIAVRHSDVVRRAKQNKTTVITRARCVLFTCVYASFTDTPFFAI